MWIQGGGLLLDFKGKRFSTFNTVGGELAGIKGLRARISSVTIR